ncbi:hypothetical protein ACFXKI_09820 [Streptomyces mirabilis]|uniref:hypothetical protein n=1 Tax=Streptomyces mirabilis TaxID=68239 RepID=UPI0036BFBCDB
MTGRRRVQADAVRQIDRSPGRALRLEQTYLVRTETVIDDDPDSTTTPGMNEPQPPRPNRATRRAQERAARRNK